MNVNREKRQISGKIQSADQVYEGVWTWTGRYRKTSEYSRIRNTIFQGLAADGMNLALKRLWCHGYKVTAVIHDKVILEIPEGDDYSGTLKEIEGLMIAGMKEAAPDMDIRVPRSLYYTNIPSLSYQQIYAD